MAIFLSVQAEDEEVETLLSYVCSRFNSHSTDEQIALLERSLKWLRAAEENAFSVEAGTRNEIRLSFDASVPLS